MLLLFPNFCSCVNRFTLLHGKLDALSADEDIESPGSEELWSYFKSSCDSVHSILSEDKRELFERFFWVDWEALDCKIVLFFVRYIVL